VRREQEELWNHTGNLDAAEELFASEQAEAARQQYSSLIPYSPIIEESSQTSDLGMFERSSDYELKHTPLCASGGSG
jgi:hypothetical protein